VSNIKPGLKKARKAPQF